MRRITTVILMFVLMLCFSTLTTYTVGASEPLGSSGFAVNATVPLGFSTCSTQEELEDVLENHSGGTVYLTNNIVINSYTNHVSQYNTELIFEMSDFGIVIDENISFNIARPLVFCGNGTETPLFTIEKGGRFSNYHYTGGQPIEIMATGDNATAIVVNGVYFQDIPRYFQPLDEDFLFTITTTGENATAVYTNRRIYLEYLKINAIGENNTAVQAWHDIDVFLCTISATGTSLSSDSGRIFIDTSVVAPLPESAIILEKKILLYDLYLLNDYGLTIKQGNDLYVPYSVTCLYESTDYPEKSRMIYMDADWNIADVMVDEIGIYSAFATLKIHSSFVELFEIDVHVIEENALLIKSVTPYKSWETKDVGATIHLNVVIPEGTPISVSVSEDNGKVWETYLVVSKAFMGDEIRIEDLKANADYLLKVEWQDGEEFVSTNVAPYKHRGIASGDLAGDRDGGDREIGEENVRPPLTTSPPLVPPIIEEPENPTKPPEVIPPVVPEKEVPIAPSTTGNSVQESGTSGSMRADKSSPVSGSPITQMTSEQTALSAPDTIKYIGNDTPSSISTDTASTTSETPSLPQQDVAGADNLSGKKLSPEIDVTTPHIEIAEKITHAVFWVVPFLVAGLGTALVVLKTRARKYTKHRGKNL